MKHLLLLHGALGAKDQLYPLADALKERYIVHTLNFSGHGSEAFRENFSIHRFADEVHHYIRQNNLDSINIFGYSMGGYVALYLAKQQPDLINKIGTLATKFHWDEAIAGRETKMLDADTIEAKVPAFAAQLRERHAPNDWKEVLERTKQMLFELGKTNALQLEDYKTIRNPCLLLLGENDKMVTMEETLAVQQALPHSSFHLLPGTPHPIEQVDKDLLVSVISGFID